MSDIEGDEIVEGASGAGKGYAQPSVQMERFRKQVEQRFLEKAAPTEAKERAEEIVHRTFASTTETDRASDSDAIQKMREQLATLGEAESNQLIQEAKTQGVSQKVMSLLQPKPKQGA